MRVRMEVGGCCTKPRDYLCVGYIILVSLNNLSYVHFRGLSLAGGHENLLFLFHIRVLDASFHLFFFFSFFIYLVLSFPPLCRSCSLYLRCNIHLPLLCSIYLRHHISFFFILMFPPFSFIISFVRPLHPNPSGLFTLFSLYSAQTSYISSLCHFLIHSTHPLSRVVLFSTCGIGPIKVNLAFIMRMLKRKSTVNQMRNC